MVLELPQPEPSPLQWMSPTLASDLLACAYRVGWRRDPRFKALRRPSVWSELGVVAHAVIEDVGKGLFDGLGSAEEARNSIEAAWNEHLSAAERDLSHAWAPAIPPPPEEWPGYHLIRARTIRRALRTFGEAVSSRATRSAVDVEHELQDPKTGLSGRPDRVEGEPGDRCVSISRLASRKRNSTTRNGASSSSTLTS